MAARTVCLCACMHANALSLPSSQSQVNAQWEICKCEFNRVTVTIGSLSFSTRAYVKCTIWRTSVRFQLTTWNMSNNVGTLLQVPVTTGDIFADIYSVWFILKGIVQLHWNRNTLEWPATVQYLLMRWEIVSPSCQVLCGCPYLLENGRSPYISE